MICSLLLRTCVKPTPFERTTAAMVVALTIAIPGSGHRLLFTPTPAVVSEAMVYYV